jgi:hypothetical protein
MQPVSLQLPARAPDYLNLPPTFTLRLQNDKKWLMTCPDGQRVQTTEDRALKWIRSVAPNCGSVVQFLDVNGHVYKVDLVTAPAPKAAPQMPPPVVVPTDSAAKLGPKAAAMAAALATRKPVRPAATSPMPARPPVSSQLPTRAPEYGVDLPPTFTLTQQADSTWLMTCPDGQRVQTTHDSALQWIRSVTPSGGSAVRFLDKAGRSYKVVHLVTPRPKLVPQTPTAVAVTASSAGRQPAREGEPPFRLFLQKEASKAPWDSWGDWKIRPWGSRYLEVEASVPTSTTPVFIVAYLVAAFDGPGLNAFAALGGIMNALLKQRQLIMASGPAQAALQAGEWLLPLTESETVNDAGLGYCSLKTFDGGDGEQESLLLWSDGQPANLSPSPHTRVLVQRTFHIALELVSEVLMLQQVLAANHVPQAPSIWDQTDSALDWLDTNLTRAGRILSMLAEILDL